MSILRPPAPGANEWRELETKLCVRLPGSLREFFDWKDSPLSIQRPRFGEFSTFSHLNPNLPPRVLPVAGTIDNVGDTVGVYFPREGLPPFVVGCRLQLGHVRFLCENPEAYFRDPEPYRARLRLLRDRDRSLPSPPDYQSTPWEQLRVNPDAGIPELECLKVFGFQVEEIGSPELRMLERLRDRFGADDRPVSRIVRRVFDSAEAIRHPRGWRQLSSALAEARLFREALRALENAVALTLGLVPNDMWRHVGDLYEMMLPLVETGGDQLDRVLIPHLLQVSRKWNELP